LDGNDLRKKFFVFYVGDIQPDLLSVFLQERNIDRDDFVGKDRVRAFD